MNIEKKKLPLHEVYQINDQLDVLIQNAAEHSASIMGNLFQDVYYRSCQKLIQSYS